MAVMAATLALAGCSSKSSSVDTSKMETSFKSAEPATQSQADKAVATVKSADYAGALTQLQSLASNAKLTPEQKQSLQDVMTQVQQAITDAASKAAGEAGKAATDLQKALKK